MLELPKSAYFGKIIAKEKIYSYGGADIELEELFVEQVERIRWLYKISPSTMNIALGKLVEEIEIIEVTLRVPTPDKRILSTIRRSIPQKVLFSVKFKDTTSYIIFFDNENNFSSSIPPRFVGNDTDSVWENFIIQIGGIEIADGRTLGEQIVINAERDKLVRKIKKLEKKAMSEKQPRCKWELAEEIQKLKQDLSNGRSNINE